MIKKIISVTRRHGFNGLIRAVLSRLYIKKAKCYSSAKEIIESGYGLEIGGLSPIFQKKNILPIYPHILSLDNCNFSHTTVWEGDITKGLTYYYDKKHLPGRQFVLEATSLDSVKDDSYDFLLSSHVIEHTANPIKALNEWIRVVKPGGHLIVLVPHKDGTFDRNRPTTSLDHLIQDFENDTYENDLTHLDEILAHHDLSLDPEAGTRLQFTERSKNNFENRCLHHHVFDSYQVVKLFDYLKLNIKTIEAISPMHILIIVQKPQTSEALDNSDILNYVTSAQFKSNFPSDKAYRQ
jgi:SAM-dependent methyltransferase